MGDESGGKSTRSAQRVYHHRETKRKGELAELAFVYKAAGLGFGVAKPYGDSERYDFILDSGERLWRVQVKSSSAMQYGAYLVNAQRHLNGRVVAYSASEIDFVVVQVVPEDAWFVIPVELVLVRKNLRLCLHGNASKGELGKYWEAWDLMRAGR